MDVEQARAHREVASSGCLAIGKLPYIAQLAGPGFSAGRCLASQSVYRDSLRFPYTSPYLCANNVNPTTCG